VLTRYAENYVPIGVKSIYYAFAGVMNPVQFPKVVTGFLFIINAVLLFFIGCRFDDNFTALNFSIGSLLFNLMNSVKMEKNSLESKRSHIFGVA